MNASKWTRTTAGTLLMCGLMLICGCQKIKGKYQGDAMGSTMAIDFKSSDKADLTMAGETKEVTYKVDGNQVTLTSPDGQNLPFTLETDGSLTGPLGVKLTKQ